MHFATVEMHLAPGQAIWRIPMSQLVLMVRQQQLVDDPHKAWTFSDEAFIAKLKRLGL